MLSTSKIFKTFMPKFCLPLVKLILVNYILDISSEFIRKIGNSVLHSVVLVSISYTMSCTKR